MRNLLVICGPTATGKTSLALRLAKKFNGEIISADSRQVYKGMDIGTGKDLPKGSRLVIGRRKQGYYLINGVKVWGYDLVSAKKEFSVGQYVKIARKIIKEILKRNKLPILVGGTGFYIKGLVDGIATAIIPKNRKFRKSLEGISVSELYDKLAQIDSIKAASLNFSDRKNPRRLIRALEIALWHLKGKYKETRAKDLDFDLVLFVGLMANEELLEERIVKRVKGRVDKGFSKEISRLKKEGLTRENQSINALGYSQWFDVLEGKMSADVAIVDWIKSERKYAKKQMSWFKRDKRINWFDISKEEWGKNVEKLVERWYKQV